MPLLKLDSVHLQYGTQVLLDAVQKLQVWGEELFAAVLDDSEAPSRKRTRTRQPRV